MPVITTERIAAHSTLFGMSLELFKAIIQIASSVAGVGAAFCALWVYWTNSRRERARWAESLYARFYEKPELKAVREQLDCAPGDPTVTELVAKEHAALTDYLNFFEFVAYLESSKQLSKGDIQALFSYYLSCLKRHKEVAAYIQNPENDFENLRRVLFDA